MDSKIYLIERTKETMDCRYYAEHGEIGGMPDAIGYETAAHARKFPTEDDALRFIQTELPEWGRALHQPTAINPAGFIFEAPELFTLLHHGASIPGHLLRPTSGRLRIWRR